MPELHVEIRGEPAKVLEEGKVGQVSPGIIIYPCVQPG